MSIIRKPTVQEANLPFDPKSVPANDSRSGKRREFDVVKGVKLLWPEGSKQRFDLFDAWHDVAMQIIHRQKAGLRLIAISKKVLRWSSGSIRISNEEMAERAGYCSAKTMSREVQAYTALGLLIAKTEWKRPSKDKFVTVRELFLALPDPLPEGTKLPNNEPLSLDNSGLDLDAVSLDNSGPGGRDNSGLATIDHKKGGNDAA